MFNPNFRPFETNPEQGSNPLDQNWAGAFNMPGLTGARLRNDGTYSLFRGTGDDRTRAKATVGKDGKVSVANWISDPVTSNAQMLRDAALTAAVAYGGLNFMGAFPGAGASTGAGFIGEGVSSGIPAWDGAMGGSMLDAGGAAGAASGAAGGSGGLLSGAVDYVKSNPRLLAGLLGAASGAVGNPQAPGYSGPMPTIKRGGWKPSVTPTYMPVQDVAGLLNWGK